MAGELVNTNQEMAAMSKNQRYVDAVGAVVMKGLSPELIFKFAAIAVAKEPKLLRCTKESIILALMKSAQTGLDCSGTTGEAYLVPYGSECTFIQGYKGMIRLVTRDGAVLKVEGRLRHEKDDFQLSFGTSPSIGHIPDLSKDPGEIVGAYAVAFLSNGLTQVEYMTRKQIDDIRAKAHGDAWKYHFGEMARKTPVRRLFKTLPVARETRELLEADDTKIFDVESKPMTAEEKEEMREEQLKAARIRKESEAEKAESESKARAAYKADLPRQEAEEKARKERVDFEQTPEGALKRIQELKEGIEKDPADYNESEISDTEADEIAAKAKEGRK